MTTQVAEPTALAIRRITIDGQKAQGLADSGMFWVTDEANILHGYAVILGPEGTPYYGGAFCFEVTFPYNYPYAPPVFNYLTNDGRTRFNPNLYKNGKVCLSLLNTWAGEPWSGAQTISSILLSIQTAVLNEEPMRNEPSYSTLSSHADIPVYNRIIQHAVVETAILTYLKNPPPYLAPFYDKFKAWALKARPVVVKKLRDLSTQYDNTSEGVNFFQMVQKYRFAKLADDYEAVV